MSLSAFLKKYWSMVNRFGLPIDQTFDYKKYLDRWKL